MHFADEVLDHFLCNFDVRDNPIAKWADRLNAVRRFAHHHLCIIPNSFNPLDPVDSLNRDDRRLVQNDALILDINECVGGPQIDRHVLRSEFE